MCFLIKVWIRLLGEASNPIVGNKYMLDLKKGFDRFRNGTFFFTLIWSLEDIRSKLRSLILNTPLILTATPGLYYLGAIALYCRGIIWIVNSSSIPTIPPGPQWRATHAHCVWICSPNDSVFDQHPSSLGCCLPYNSYNNLTSIWGRRRSM